MKEKMEDFFKKNLYIEEICGKPPNIDDEYSDIYFAMKILGNLDLNILKKGIILQIQKYITSIVGETMTKEVFDMMSTADYQEIVKTVGDINKKYNESYNVERKKKTKLKKKRIMWL